MITAIAGITGVIAKVITNGLVDKLLEIYKLKVNGEISESEFNSRIEIAKQETAAKIEQAWAEAAAKMAESFQSTIRTSPVIQRTYASVMFMQLFVLFWYQIGASAFKLATGVDWPTPTASIEWSYLLIAAMIGIGPLVIKRQGA